MLRRFVDSVVSWVGRVFSGDDQPSNVFLSSVYNPPHLEKETEIFVKRRREVYVYSEEYDRTLFSHYEELDEPVVTSETRYMLTYVCDSDTTGEIRTDQSEGRTSKNEYVGGVREVPWRGRIQRVKLEESRRWNGEYILVGEQGTVKETILIHPGKNGTEYWSYLHDPSGTLRKVEIHPEPIGGL